MKIEILGTPFNGLGTEPNIENPADGLRQANLIPSLESKGHSVIDLGDLSGFQFRGIRDPETQICDFNQWIDLSKALSKELETMIDRESFPLLLGGDCSMLVGIVSAFAQRDQDVGLIFLDGHADFHTPESSPSGDPADMELAVLTGRGSDKITRIADKYPLLNDNDVVVYGIRAWDNIFESDIKIYDTKLLEKIGIKRAVDEGMESYSRRNLPLWLHFDVDVLDPEIMPVMFPEPGGLTIDEVQEFLGLLMWSYPIIGMSIACYHPSLDEGEIAGARIVTLLSNVFTRIR